MKLIDQISESSKQVYSEYLSKCEALGMPDTANKDAAVSMAIVGSRCRIEEIEIVSGFVASQSAKMARLRKAIEDFVSTDYEDMTIESIQSDMRKAIGE
jgi:hypothetical protein